ncbi:hypothetical protein [Nocardiopsis kunsanensis]|nr:hypothetical protein [Nocardiopsis kunsanensis]
MSEATLLASDLADLEEITVDDLFAPAPEADEDPSAIMCSCCCSSCGC